MSGLEKLPGLLASGDWPAAERLLKRAAKTRADDAAILYNLGRVLMEQEKWAPARHWLTRATRVRAQHQAAWFELGRTALALGDLDEACEAFGRALSLDPSDVDARRNLGRVALRLGRHDLARDAFLALEGADIEVEAALYRIAAETRAPDAAERRAALLARDTDKAQALTALTRVARGSLPLNL